MMTANEARKLSTNVIKTELGAIEKCIIDATSRGEFECRFFLENKSALAISTIICELEEVGYHAQNKKNDYDTPNVIYITWEPSE